MIPSAATRVVAKRMFPSVRLRETLTAATRNILHLIIIHALSLFLLLQPFFVERAFRIFDRDKNGTVSMSEFIETMHQFAGQSTDEKLVFLFKVYDLDGESVRLRVEGGRGVISGPYRHATPPLY